MAEKLVLLICTVAFIRVEIINQRVHSVEDLLAEDRQDPVKVSTDASSFKHTEGVESVGECDKKERDATEGNDFVLLNKYTTRPSEARGGLPYNNKYVSF